MSGTFVTYIALHTRKSCSNYFLNHDSMYSTTHKKMSSNRFCSSATHLMDGLLSSTVVQLLRFLTRIWVV